MSVFCDEAEPRFVWRKNAGSLFTPRLPRYRIDELCRQGRVIPLRFGARSYLDIKQLEDVVRSSPISTPPHGGSNV